MRKGFLLSILMFGYVGCGNSSPANTMPSLAESSIPKAMSVSLDDNKINITSKKYGTLMHGIKSDIIKSPLKIVDEKVTVQKGGFDIEFSLKNETQKSQNLLFDIEIPALHLAQNSDAIKILNTANYMVPVPRKIAKGEDASINLTANNSPHALTYPRGYSPVIVLEDDHIAIGASILTSFNQEHIALVQRVKHNGDGTWSMIFENSSDIARLDDPVGMKGFETKRLAANAKEKFHVTVRFADVSGDKERNWLTTLAPYKAFFDKRFADRNMPVRDTRPILDMTFSYNYPSQNSKEGHDSEYTQRGYGLSYFRNEQEAMKYASDLKEKMLKSDFKRVVFWAVSGQYYGYPYHNQKDAKADGVMHPNPLQLASTFNLPSQLFGNLQPNIQYIVRDIKHKFENSGIEYGFWWGRAGQIPVKNGHIITNSEWNPDHIVDSNFLQHKYHLNFAQEQLGYAMMYGAKEIGLDAFGHMSIDAQLPWIKEMKKFSKNSIKFMQEGIMCDYLHTEMSLFLQPEKQWYNKLTQKHFTSPPLLADYLNPNAEIIVWSKHIDNDYMNQLRSLGFTPCLEVGNGKISDIPLYHEQNIPKPQPKEQKKNIKIFVIGDSTTFNNNRPKGSQMGWAEDKALGTYMKNPSNLFDQGAYGRTSINYKNKARHAHDWEETQNLIKNTDTSAGAYLLIQFGHNDEHDKQESLDNFYDALKDYVDWARSQDIIPVLITSVERRVDSDGDGIADESHGLYPDTVRRLAQDEGVILLDLQKKSLAEYRKIGNLDAINQAVAPTEGKGLQEHFSAKGAKMVAGWVKELICDDKSNKQELCAQFK